MTGTNNFIVILTIVEVHNKHREPIYRSYQSEQKQIGVFAPFKKI